MHTESSIIPLSLALKRIMTDLFCWITKGVRLQKGFTVYLTARDNNTSPQLLTLANSNSYTTIFVLNKFHFSVMTP